MNLLNRTLFRTVTVILTAAFVAVGCHQKDDKTDTAQAKGKTETAKKVDKGGHEEHGWWCEEHGIPEDECGLCNKTYRDKKKTEDDWCETHARLKSQCFKCDPSLYEKVFEPKYVAKFGKKPPRPPESEFTK